MRKPRGELLHLAFGTGHLFFEQHLEIGADHLIAVRLGGLVVRADWSGLCGAGSLTRLCRTKSGGLLLLILEQTRRAALGMAGSETRPHTSGVLLNLPKNPRIRGGHPANHHGVASGLGDHGAGVFGRTNVAVADHRNLDRLLYGSDPFPASVSAVALLASTGVERDRAQAAVFG